MRRLTHAEWLARVRRRDPGAEPSEPYCKANVPIPVRCGTCGHTVIREANAHIRFGCPHCRTISRDTSAG